MATPSRSFGFVIVALDDKDCHRRVTTSLMQSGYQVVSEVPLSLLEEDPRQWLTGCDALLVDAGEKGERGAAFCTLLRRTRISVPVMVSAVSADDVLSCLEAGAMDGMTRPLRLGDLAARVRALQRHQRRAEGPVLPIGPFRFAVERRELSRERDRKPIRLPPFEACVLRRLYAGRGEAVSRAALLQELWNHSPDARAHTVEGLIYQLRRKLEPDVKRYRLLQTLSSGYRLNTSGDQ